MPPLLALCGAFLIGILWAEVPAPWLYAGIAPAALLCLLVGSTRLAPWLALAFVAGLIRAVTVPLPAIDPPALLTSPGLIEYRGVVAAYPDPTSNGERFAVDLRSAGGSPARGRVMVQTARPDLIRYGDLIAFRARLEPVGQAEPAGWRDFLLRRGVAATTFAGTVRRVAGDQGPRPWQALAAFRDDLGRAIDRSLPAPERDLARGLTLGDRGIYAPELTAALRRSGLGHIVAVSGFNVVVVAGSIWAIAGAVWGRRPAFWIGLPFVGAYAVLTGFEPPVVRAALMTALAGFGWWLGRPVTVAVLLALSATILVIAEPRMLGDVSFLLSFAATGGLVYVLARPVDDRSYEAAWPIRLADGIRGAVLTTAVATLATLPITLSSFGTVSLVAPISNVLAEQLIAPATIATGALALAGWALPWQFVADLLALPVLGLLRTIIVIAQVTGNLAGATISLPEWQPFWAWPIYGLLAIVMWLRGLRTLP